MNTDIACLKILYEIAEIIDSKFTAEVALSERAQSVEMSTFYSNSIDDMNLHFHCLHDSKYAEIDEGNHIAGANFGNWIIQKQKPCGR